MIEISYEKPEQRRIVDVSPFAWLSWPLEILAYAARETKYAFLTAANMGHLELTQHIYKGGLYRYEGDELKCIQHEECFLWPVTTYMEFETEADYRRYIAERERRFQSH